MARMVEQALGLAKFTSTCGENSEATSQQGLKVNEEVEINGSTDLSKCIIGNSGACVYSIVKTGKGPGNEEVGYDYLIAVDGKGPKGYGSGSLTLAFHDESPDIYHLTLTSSTRKMHYLRYNSRRPDIKKITWHNTLFEVES
jgi:hypothetical protein